jgi:hypothetical protein
MSRSNVRRRWAWRLALIAVALLVAIIAWPTFHLIRTARQDREEVLRGEAAARSR